MTQGPNEQPTSSDGFEITTDGESVLGPVTAGQLRQWRVSGRLPAKARARRVGGDGSWTPIDILLASLGSPAVAARRTELLIGSGVAGVVVMALVVGFVVRGSGREGELGRQSEGPPRPSSQDNDQTGRVRAAEEAARLRVRDEAEQRQIEVDKKMRVLLEKLAKTSDLKEIEELKRQLFDAVQERERTGMQGRPTTKPRCKPGDPLCSEL